MINVLDRDAKIIDDAMIPEAYRGLDRYEARKRIVADLEEQGLVEKIEPHTHMLPHGDRSGMVIEPWLTDQWYCDAVTLAQPAIKAVEEGRTVFVPKQWKTPISNGCATSSPGASAARSGGAIRFRMVRPRWRRLRGRD